MICIKNGAGVHQFARSGASGVNPINQFIDFRHAGRWRNRGGEDGSYRNLPKMISASSHSVIG